MTQVRLYIQDVILGLPAAALILGVGLFLTLRLGFPQLGLFPRAVGLFFRRMFAGKRDGGVSSFQALCTALAATVGTGNLVGVAGAICLGGPGAIFWMWVCAFFGMATKYAEAALAVRYRVKTPDGYAGGPMYTMTYGLGQRFRPLAKAYCVFGILAAFGVGNTAQVNAVVTGVNAAVSRFGGQPSRMGNLLMGLTLAVLAGFLLFGGAKRIGAAAETLVPLAAGAYLLLCVGVLLVFRRRIPIALGQILTGAFCPRAVTGGMLGSAFRALCVGCRRGVFTNEAGMGTASIAHACAEAEPAEQGLMGMMEVFLDTIVICTLTALVILVSGVPVPYGVDTGAELTTRAFSQVYGAGASVFLAAALILFAVATILGWGLYGARCAQFLFGGWKGFAAAQTAMVVLGAVLDTETVWQLSELANGLMALPNLICLAALTTELRRITKEYKNPAHLAAAGGGNYADFH
ncbi:MAG: amino acid carrier protein [Candidatus Faecousia sp.]|nr:amino acid carrier protein [Candidatus Faecousia sp.]